MKTTLIVIAAILITNTAFAASCSLMLRAEVKAPPVELVNTLPNDNKAYYVVMPKISDVPAGLTEQEAIDYLNARIVIPEELKADGFEAFYSLGPQQGVTK